MSNYRGAAGVIGWPVAHSKSPKIHRFWLAKLGLDGDYGRFAIRAEDLAQVMAAFPALGLNGLNVTVPHKSAVMAHLDQIDPVAKAIGAVNTVVLGQDGRTTGYNTDMQGFAAPLRACDLKGKSAVIIGAGGGTRAVVGALQMLGVEIIAILNRTAARAQQLAQDFASHSTQILPLDAPLPATDLLINASTMGLKNIDPYAPDLSALPATAIVYDIVYDPLETALLAAARARGLITIDGLEMLIGQAAAAFTYFYGAEPPRHYDGELKALLSA